MGRAAVEAVRRARAGGGGPVLAAAVLDAPADWDPAAIAFAARRPGEPLWIVEQPDRDGRALAGLGAVASLGGSGDDRFASVAAAWRRVAGRATGEGVLALGGFAFAPDGGGSPAWEGFPGSSLVVPEVALVRERGEVRLVLAARADPDDTPEDLEARVAARLASLRAAALPLLDPAPVGRTRVVSALAPEHYEEAVGRAVERIRDGEFEKIVLAREVQVHAPVDHDAAAVHGVLREAFPSCFTYCVARGDAAFLGASPELLVRREGQRASTVALAGSTRR
ncbi:MAG TPA: chorismate-binding protein, partial [Solirubrobacteraceae bacterium]